MSDLISRQAAIDAVSSALQGVFVEHESCAKSIIGKIPAVEPERKTGEWLPVKKSLLGHTVIMNYCCSECKEKAYQDENGNDFLTNFCPNCGAEMEV